MQPNSLPESISDFPKSYQRNLCHWNMPALSMHNQNLHHQDISFFYNFENFETPPLKIHFDIYLFLGQSRNTSRVCGGRCPLDSQTQYFKCFSLKFKLNQDNIALFWSKTEASDSWGRPAMDEVRFCCYFQCHRGTANVCWFDHNISFPIVTVKISTIQYFKELQKKVYFKF